MSTREKSMKKLQEEFDKHVEIRTEYKAGRRSSDAHPDQSLLAENARLKSFLGKLASRIGLDSQSIKFEAVWGDPKNIQTHLELCQKNMERWFIEIKEALSQSPANTYAPALQALKKLADKSSAVIAEHERIYSNYNGSDQLTLATKQLKEALREVAEMVKELL